MVLLALTTPIRAVQKPSCHEFHSHSHQLLFLRDVMAMYRVTQNEVLPRNLLFPLQCATEDGSSILQLALLPKEETITLQYKLYIAVQCQLQDGFSWKFLCRFLKMPHKRMLKQERLDHICLYYGAECAKTRERKWDRLKLF